MSEPHSLKSRPSGPEGTTKSLKEKSFVELFDRDELVYYGVAAVLYILLGLFLRDIVLNWIIGPAFITLWMWQVPAQVEKWKERRS